MLHSHYRSQDKGAVVVLRVQFTNLLNLKKKKLNSFFEYRLFESVPWSKHEELPVDNYAIQLISVTL